MCVLAVDAMGGDIGPDVVVPACIAFLAKPDHTHVIVELVGRPDVVEPLLAGELAQSLVNSQRLVVIPATEVVAMDELPSQALRKKKDSSMRVALDRVAAGQASACVSAGNTGALMASARFVLKMIPSIDRPAILTRMPTCESRVTRVLDLGANVDSSAEQLVQFAAMGAVVAEFAGQVAAPRVGLLNVGEEEIKGNDVVKATHQLLSQMSELNYIGYVEGNDLFSGNVDIVVCDGFVGNIALKAVEGVSSLIMKNLVGSFKKNLFSQLSGLLARSVLKDVKQQVDPRTYNGAVFAGLNGIVIKSHGSADEVAFMSALAEALVQVENNAPERMASRVQDIMKSAVVNGGE